MDKFRFRIKYGEFDGCWFRPERYTENDNLALAVYNDEGCVCVCTVNPGVKLPDEMIAVKDYSENEGVADALVRLGVICKREVGRIPSGWVNIPLYRLTERGKEIFANVAE